MKVRIEIDSRGRIAADIPYDNGRGPKRAKEIPGHNPVWRDKGKPSQQFLYWAYPLAMSVCRRFREEFGNDLEIGPKLTEWAWEQRRTEESLEELRAGGSADLPRVRETSPMLWEALLHRPFQIAGAAFVAKGGRVCLGDEPRLGKTYQALAAIVETGAHLTLIACPRTAARTVWMRKINELTPQIMPFVAQGDRAKREQVIQAFSETPYAQKALIINLEMLRTRRAYRCIIQPHECNEWRRVEGERNLVPVINKKIGWPESRSRPGTKHGCPKNHPHKTMFYPEYPQLFSHTWDAIVLDESHNALASTKNKQSDAITQIRLGAVRLESSAGGIRLAMSGTPFRSKVEKAWGTLNWLRPDVFSSFWRFAEEQFGVIETGYMGAKVIGTGLKDEKKFQDMLRPYYLARTKAEVAPQLPPVAYAGTPPISNPDGPVGVYVGMEDKQSQAYWAMARMASARLESGTIRANGVLAELTRLKQLACAYGRIGKDGIYYPAVPSGKLSWILDFLEERRERPGKVVIATQFTKLVKLMAEEIRKAGWEVVTLTGESTDKQREHMQDTFQRGKPRVAIINLFAGGEAIDLAAADEIIFTDEPWTADAITQAENRVQSLAKRQQVTVYRLRSEGTVDEHIAELTEEQRKMLTGTRPEAVALASQLAG